MLSVDFTGQSPLKFIKTTRAFTHGVNTSIDDDDYYYYYGYYPYRALTTVDQSSKARSVETQPFKSIDLILLLVTK
jgi:hypothetical protein